MGTDWVVFICFFFLSSNARVEPGTLLMLGKCPTTELRPHGPILQEKEHTSFLHA